ncbi:MAG: hypothetical protein J5641_01530, partial [Bacteroidales bacterium]|nr:hypothetical protein [Bacteroidales bacterium]
YRFLPILTDSYRIVPILTDFYRLTLSIPLSDGIWMGYEWDMDGITDEGRAAKEWSQSEGRTKDCRDKEGYWEEEMWVGLTIVEK